MTKRKMTSLELYHGKSDGDGEVSKRKRRKIELKMFSPQIVLDKIAEKIVEIVIESVGRHLGYPFHYKQNVKDLEVQMDKLQQLRKTIEVQIEEAKTRGEVIMDNVSDWLNGADGLRQGVETFMHDKIDKENVRCFKFSCHNFISRYKLSKEAEKKMGDVKSLSEKANFGTISQPAPTPPELQFPSSEEYVSFDSRESVFNRIKDALADTKVNVVGVYGLGGVGKTTMVEKVGEQVKKDGLFDEVVMAVVSQDVKVVNIQGVLADHLNLKLEKTTREGRASELWNRLNNGKRNLVILDDIWKKLNLKEIGIPITDGKKGCKVILTSRNQHVLKDMQVDKDFLIQVLLEQEAWNLFEKKTNVVDSHDPLHGIVKAVCRECRGLPVAILAVGAALKGKSMPAWKSSLDKLKKSMMNTIEDIDPNLFTSLRLSYDFLESTDAKSCFLLCCLFPEDSQVPIEALARHCMARRLLGQKPDTLEDAIDIVCAVVDTLKTRCLLLDGENDDFVKMHDVIRDVAISIAKEEEVYLVKHGVQEWPETGTYEKYSTISLMSETIHELPDELVCPELHTLMLECSSWWSTKIPDKFFRGTEKLMVLELNKATVLPLPSSLGKLTELRMLCLNECELGDIAILKDLKNKLEVLILRGSNIKALPPVLGELTRLRLLDLGDCRELEVIPNGVISKLQRLEELHFPVSFENWKGTTANEEISKVSVEELMSLTRLSTLHICIPFLRLLPEDLGFLNLSRFFIVVGSHWSEYDGDCLKRETFSSTSVVLNLVNFENEGLIDFSILERLLGKPKWSIERGGLCPSRSFNNLTELVVEHCESKSLFSPSCAGLLQLQRLVIRDCGTMEAVIGNLGNEEEKDEEIVTNVINFSQLATLELSKLPRFISFYPRIKKATATESHSFPPAQSLFNEKVAFPALEELSIVYVPNTTEIWDKKNLLPTDQSFCLLRSLKVVNCEELMNVVPSHVLPRLRNVESLEVCGCSKMEVIVVLEKREEEATNKDIIPFPELRTLRLSYLENLKGFCAYKSEDQLDFNVQVVFPKLRIMSLAGSGRLSSFNNTSSIIETRPLFNHQVAFPALEELYIFSVPNITEIWDKKNLLPTDKSFRLLRSLVVRDCEELMNVVPSHVLPRLRNVESLEVCGCSKMEVIVVLEEREEEATNKDIIPFPELRTLKLEYLENLKAVCAYKSEDQHDFNVQVVFPKLRIMSLAGSGRLSSFNNTSSIIETRPLFNHQVAFPALEELRIYLVPNITEIWDKKNLLPTDQSFRLLRSLEVWHCEKLMNVVPSHMLPRLRNVESLEVRFCSKMEVIVVLEEREEEATNKDIIPFPELRTLKLAYLENLKAVCAYKSEDQHDFNVQVVFPKFRIMSLAGSGRLSSFNNTSSIIETRPLFNHQVAFPALEELSISSVPNITEIWDKKNLLPTDQSFCLLRSLKVFNCEELMNVVPSHVLPRLRNVEALEVYGCSRMEVIVVLEKREEEATNKDIIPFPELRTLELENLENLKGFCAYKSEDQLDFNVQVVFPKFRIMSLAGSGRLSSFNNTSSIIETRPLFNHQVAFPALEELSISSVPNITEIWDKKNLLPTDKSFCLLRSLVVQNCEELMTVVPSHVLPRLRNVESLEVYGCSKMEVIVVLEKREEGATNKDIIPFPELRTLELENLENLKEVCAYRSKDQLDFNVQVVFPKLRKRDFRVHLPSLKNFHQECAIMDASGNRIWPTPYNTHSEELEW